MHDCLHDIERDIDGEDLFDDGMMGEAGLKGISITGRLPECKFQRPEAVSFPFIMSFLSFVLSDRRDVSAVNDVLASRDRRCPLGSEERNQFRDFLWSVGSAQWNPAK